MLSKQLESNVLALNAIDKANLVDILLSRFNPSDKEVKKKWVDESEKRFDAYKAGKLKGTSLQEVQAKYEV